MTVMAYIEIWNPILGVHFQTASEEHPSEKDAKESFLKVAEGIESLESPSSNICIETTTGLMIFTQKFLSDSLLRLKIELY